MKQLPYINKTEGIIGYEDSVIAKSEKNDCFVRAIASSFEIPYDEAHQWVRVKFARENGKGTRTHLGLSTLCVSKERLNNKYFKKVENLRAYLPEKTKYKRTTLNQFLKLYPTGTYVIIVRHHAFTLKNGMVIGNPEDASSLKKIVYCAYQVC